LLASDAKSALSRIHGRNKPLVSSNKSTTK